MRTTGLLVAAMAVAYAAPSSAQTVNLPNPGFEAGANVPDGWTLPEGNGEWVRDAQTGEHCVSVTGSGDDTNFWRTPPLKLEPSAWYQLRFRARNLTASSGTAISGPAFCNRDLGLPPGSWTDYRTVFFTPANVNDENAWIRFGQWHANGSVAFDDVAVVPLQPIFKRSDPPFTWAGPICLGAGESITGNEYEFNATLGGENGNASRPLESFTCAFNTQRWVFGQGSTVTYAHVVMGRHQTKGRVEVNVNLHESGALTVEADRGDDAWLSVGTLDAAGRQVFDLPDTLFPAATVRVRLTGTSREGQPVSLQVDGYRYTAQIDGDPITLVGTTQYMGMPRIDPRLDVSCTSLGDGHPGGDNVLRALVTNRTNANLELPCALTIAPQEAQTGVEVYSKTLTLPQGASQPLEVPYEVQQSGAYDLTLTLGGPRGYRGESSFYSAPLFDASYGERLPGSNDVVGMWWASSGWKVSRDRPMPRVDGDAMLIQAARNEAEAAQLVVRPRDELTRLTALAGDLKGPNGAVIRAGNIDVLRVRYVAVSRPTDATGTAAPGPDPLPPFAGGIDVPAGVNQPLWVRVNVPRDVAPGVYSGIVRLKAKGFEARVPLRVEVFGFTLPDRPTCTTTFGFSPGNVFRYQQVSDPDQQREVLDQYWKDFSAHRIAPYNPAPLDNFAVTWPGLDAWKKGESKDLMASFTPSIDWSAWDAAMGKAIDGYGFNSFVLPIAGMGGGTFHSRTEPSLLGYGEDTPEYKAAFGAYCRAVQEHLRQKGWLDEAYVYWFDEPDPKDYAFVMNGFNKIKEAAPDIRRMLTEQVEPALVGGPTIWCPISNAFSLDEAQPRMAAGDSFWWYVCTGPKAPYCTLFIDHPATELRVWLWQTWQRGISGILVWQSNYWTSDTAYPEPESPQNPYADPMGWTSGYSTPKGTRRPWGNGDGRFIYPPEAAADARPGNPVLAGPVDSIRWEMLRDGVEDYEYLVILRDLIAQREQAGVSAEALQPFKALLEVPGSITSSMTEFTKNPAPIETRRAAIARAIESLQAQG